jgi:hypothetical protein
MRRQAPAPDVTGRTPQLITQEYLDKIDGHSSAFIDKALANASLRGASRRPGQLPPAPGRGDRQQHRRRRPQRGRRHRSLGLPLRPGCRSQRPGAARLRRAGRAGVRAAGNLNVYGSINDGFAPPPATPDDNGLVPVGERKFGQAFTAFGGDIVVPIDGVVLDKGTVFPKDALLNYDMPAQAMKSCPVGTVLPVDVTLLRAR